MKPFKTQIMIVHCDIPSSSSSCDSHHLEGSKSNKTTSSGNVRAHFEDNYQTGFFRFLLES